MSSNAPEPSDSTGTSNGIQHMPRKRAMSPGFGPKFEPEPIIQPDPSSPEAAMIHTRESRYGPGLINAACYSGAAAVAFTYVNGFYHLYHKNRAGWTNTFKHRLMILSPLLAMYACGNGIIPMPFKRHFEQLSGRRALSTMDVYKAKDSLLIKQAASKATSDAPSS